MEEIFDELDTIVDAIKKLEKNLGGFTEREVALKILRIRKLVAELNNKLNKFYGSKSFRMEIKKAKEKIDKIITILNRIKYENESTSSVSVKGFFSYVSWPFVTFVFIFLGGFSLYLHFLQEGIEVFFYQVYAKSDSIIFLSIIIFFLVVTQLACPYWLVYMLTSKQMKPNGKIEACLFYSSYIFYTIAIVYFSFLGYRLVFSFGFSLLATICWLLMLLLIYYLFNDIEKLDDYEGRKHKILFFLLLWIVSLLMAFLFSLPFPFDRSYDFSKLFSKIGFVQNQPSWQKVSKSYLGDIANEVSSLKNNFRFPRDNPLQDSTEDVYLYGIVKIDARNVKIFCPYNDQNPRDGRGKCRVFSPNDLIDVTNLVPIAND